MDENLATKYAELFKSMYKKDGFKKACDYMGTYFYGLIDNIPFDVFMKNYYGSFVGFADWLDEVTEDEVWTDAYGDKKPFLYQLVDLVEETASIPDPIDVAIAKGLANLTENGLRRLYDIATYYMNQNKQLIFSVDIWDGDRQIYVFDTKFSKKQVKDEPDTCREQIIGLLALIVHMNGAMTITARDKNSDTISAFVAQDATLYTISKNDIKKMFPKTRNKRQIFTSEYSFDNDGKVSEDKYLN